jgi:hypothetical protein
MFVMKKMWLTPELVVLVKSKPEETVLAACKWWLTPGGDPSISHDGSCKEGCPPCNEQAVS